MKQSWERSVERKRKLCNDIRLGRVIKRRKYCTPPGGRPNGLCTQKELVLKKEYRKREKESNIGRRLGIVGEEKKYKQTTINF